MLTDEVKAEREAVLLAHMKGESDKDVDAVLATMPQPTYDLVTVGRIITGKEAVGRFLQNMFDRLGPNTHHAERIHHLDDEAIVEVMTQFPDGLLGTTPGEELRVYTVGIFPFEGTTMLAERLYADPGALVPLLEGV